MGSQKGRSLSCWENADSYVSRELSPFTQRILTGQNFLAGPTPKYYISSKRKQRREHERNHSRTFPSTKMVHQVPTITNLSKSRLRVKDLTDFNE